jgi:M6 family metalloprotease-like protein
MKCLIFSLRHLGLAIASLLAVAVFAVPKFNVPVSISQPDGSKVECLGSGDEYGYRLFDRNNYTIVKEQGGYAAYAVQAADGKLASSGFRVGKVNPAAAGLQPGITESPAAVQTRLASRGTRPGQPNFLPINLRKIQGTGGAAAAAAGPAQAGLGTGSFNNVVLFIKFKETGFTKTKTSFTQVFNADANSLKAFYKEVSYSQLTINSLLNVKTGEDLNATSVIYEDSQPYGHYCPYNAVSNPIGFTDATAIETEAMAMRKKACQWLEASGLVTGQNLDADGDGMVDSICIIYATEINNRDAIKTFLPTNKQSYDVAKYAPVTGWSDPLWPSSWAFKDNGVGDYTTTVAGKTTYHYIQQGEGEAVATYCHEMFHLLGSEDYYRYNYDGDPIGVWDLMSDTSGQQMCAYLKWKVGGWIPDEKFQKITTTGKYTLYPTYSTPATDKHVLYRIDSKKTDDYFVVEYRKKDSNSFDKNLTTTQSGLLVYRVNTKVSGNANGAPDELYIYRPGETKYTANCAGQLEKAAFAADWNRTSINNTTDPRCFLEDDSDGGLKISGVTTASDTISFYVDMGTSTASLAVEPATQTVNSAAGLVGTYTVTASKPGWTAATTATAWATVAKAADGNSFTVTTATANASAQDRTADIVVTAADAAAPVTVKFIQKAAGTTAAGNLVVTPTTATYAAAGGTTSFTVTQLPTGAAAADLSISSPATWLTFSINKQASPPTISITAAANAGAVRNTTATVAAGSKSVVLTLYQYAATTSGTVEIKIDNIAPQATSAVASCSLAATGVTISERGVCWSSSKSLPTVADSKGTGANGATYTVTLTGLATGKQYYARAYAKSSTGSFYYSTAKTFIAEKVPDPMVVSGVKLGGYYIVVLQGTIIFPPDYLVLERGFVYGTAKTPTTANATVVKAGAGRGIFSAPLEKRTALATTTYYMRAYAVTATGTIYGNEVSFKFQAPLAK